MNLSLFNVDIVNRHIICHGWGILIFIRYFRRILISHCISILIFSFVWTSDDETGYSVYLGFPELHAVCKSFEEK